VDKDGARLTVVHIPTAIIPTQDYKLKAQVEVLGPSEEILERSKVYDIHFPKTGRKTTTTVARVRVEPELRDTPGVEQADQYKVADAVAPVAIQPQRPSAAAPLAATCVEQPNAEAARAVPSTIRAEHSDEEVNAAAVAIRADRSRRDNPSNTRTHESLSVLPSALDGSGWPSD
jgi:hypothetical protein